MIINGVKYDILSVYDLSITIPDSFVICDNKTCNGHGEAKLYMGSKELMRDFYAGNTQIKGFEADCFVLKSDLMQYMNVLKHEYYNPSIIYRGQETRKNIAHLWKQRVKTIEDLSDVITFKIKDQDQIKGNRGYVKAKGNTLKGGYGIIRTVSLPFVTYLSVMKLQNTETGGFVFYWKIFADFYQMAEQQYWAKHYGQKKSETIRKKREGQIKYKQDLFSQFGKCPFSKIDDVRLLIASHIKPWAVCNEHEKVDPNNGFILSPLFDKLFDKGYITFEDNGRLKISNWLSDDNRNRIDFQYNINDLHLTPQRCSYLDYHRKNVFK